MIGYKAKRIIVHCSDSDWGDVTEIRKWHTIERGWKDIGYNGIILNGHPSFNTAYNKDVDGMFQEGRSLDFDAYVDKDEKAAHCLGYNHDSIGICLIGKKQFTTKQFLTLYHFYKVFRAINPEIELIGHREMPTANGKTCPNLPMSTLRDIFNEDMALVGLIEAIMLELPIKREGAV